MSVSDLAMQKRRLRGAMLARLAGVGDVRVSAGRALCLELTKSALWRDAARVALFVSRADEIDTEPLLERALEEARPLLLPRVARKSVLEFAVVRRLARLRVGRFGIMEPPAEAPASDLAAGDLVLVPGLAFDRQGGRLGRGVGYYDRALARFSSSGHRPRLVGVGFSFQLIEQVPMDGHDVRMDGVATESAITAIRRDGLIGSSEAGCHEGGDRE